MTCQQLGGPCDHALTGADANDVIKAQDAHLKQCVADGDDAHRGAADEMAGRWKHPISGMRWYKRVKRDFADLAGD